MPNGFSFWFWCYLRTSFMKTTSHSLIHHDFSRYTNFGLWWTIINTWEVCGTIEVFLLINLHLFKDIVFTCVSFHLFQYQIVSWRYLIMFVVLYVCNNWLHGLIAKLFLELRCGFINNRDSIFAHNDAIHIVRLDLVKPIMSSDIFGCETSGWICIEDFLN
jgi:hypothetical protein